MSEIVPTLFGLSPEAFQQQRQDRVDERALALAQLDPFQRASFNIQRGADRLAGVVGGMLGGQDPELQRRTQAQQIFGTIDPSDPDTFLRAAEMALQGGDQQLAFGLRQEGEKARQQALVRGDQERVRQGLRAEDDRKATDFINEQVLQATVRGAFVPGTPAQEQFVEVDDQGQPVAIPAVPASFDLESIRAELLQTDRGREELAKLEKLTQPEEFNLGDRRFRRDSNNNLIEVISATPPKPGITTRQLTPAEAKLRGLPDGKSYQIDSTGKISVIGGGGVSVQVGGTAENEYAKVAGKATAERDIKVIENAQSVSGDLPKMYEARQLLETGDLNTGFAAEFQQVIDRAKTKILSDKRAGKRVTDTEYLDALLGSDVFPQISQLGIGARGLDTPAEREFLRQVITGSISMDRETLKRMTDFRIKSAENAVKSYNKKLRAGNFKQYQEVTGRRLDPIQMQTAAPELGTTANPIKLD